MIMKRWRIGSLSMGLTLIASGILMLTSLIAKVDALKILLTFWPVILITLGAEILLHLFVRRDDDTRLRYDVFSIIFIGFLLMISMVFYSVSYFLGLLEAHEEIVDLIRRL